MAVIVVATDDFELYHDLVNELHRRDVEFSTVKPGTSLPGDARVVLSGPGDDVTTAADVDHIRTTVDRSRHGVEAAIAAMRGAGGDTVIGVDPGDRPGIAVVRGELVVSAYQVPFADAVDTIRDEVAADPDAVVRIGDGARLKGAQLINGLEDVSVELVDETGTTPYLGSGARGTGDVLAAVNIAQRPGEPIETREVDPTAGELASIQHRSRDLSPTNRQIDEALAERVAAGELTVEEALEEHREG